LLRLDLAQVTFTDAGPCGIDVLGTVGTLTPWHVARGYLARHLYRLLQNQEPLLA
jgi:hypothetical protein